jgi:predicted enzyme related to lactoylglutathione lyase
MPGQLVHFEIPADDTAEAREFWGSLFGWKFESFPGPFEYHMTQISEETGGAITNMEPGKRRGARLLRCGRHQRRRRARERARRRGGRAAPGAGMGWFAVCRDPEGNDFGLWQSDTAAPAPSE